MPIRTAPFFAVPLCAGITYTMGGARHRCDARVQHRDGGAIAGLYAAGATIGGLEGGPVTGYTGGLAKALTSASSPAKRPRATSKGIKRWPIRAASTCIIM